MQFFYVNKKTRSLVMEKNKELDEKNSIYFAVKELCAFKFFEDENSTVFSEIEEGEYYLAGNTDYHEYDKCCFLSQQYTIENDSLIFEVDTYNDIFQSKVKLLNTKLSIELGFKPNSSESYTPILSSCIHAQPRVFVDGVMPESCSTYYTKEEIDNNFAVGHLTEMVCSDLLYGNFNANEFSLNKLECHNYQLFQNVYEDEDYAGQLTFDLDFVIDDEDLGINTKELHVCCNYDISSFVFENCVPIDFPDELTLIDNQDWTTHIFIVRAQKIDDTVKFLINYNYSI